MSVFKEKPGPKTGTTEFKKSKSMQSMHPTAVDGNLETSPPKVRSQMVSIHCLPNILSQQHSQAILLGFNLEDLHITVVDALPVSQHKDIQNM